MEIEREYCSNGECDSSWTLYLQSSLHHRGMIECGEDHDSKFYCDYQQNEDDLSMVSDASSGPPLDLVYHDNHNDDQDEIDINIHNHNNYNKNDIKKKKNNNGSKLKRAVKFIKPDNEFALDDTASSHIFTFPSKGNGEENNQGCSFESSIDYYYSQGFSATQFQERSLSTKFEQDCYGFLDNPYPTKIYQQNQW